MNTPGAARAATIIIALMRVSHQVSIVANEMILLINPRVIAPMIGPAIPPIPPLIAVPPITAAVIAVRVIAEPISALPDPLSIVIAIPAKADIRPEIT